MTKVLDTSFLVDVSREHTRATALLREFANNREILLIPCPAVTEYLAGSRDPEGDLGRLRDAGELVPFNEQDAVAAGRIAREALRSGAFPGWIDALIAGMAQNRGPAEIVTANPRHFPNCRTLSY